MFHDSGTTDCRMFHDSGTTEPFARVGHTGVRLSCRALIYNNKKLQQYEQEKIGLNGRNAQNNMCVQ